MKIDWSLHKTLVAHSCWIASEFFLTLFDLKAVSDFNPRHLGINLFKINRSETEVNQSNAEKVLAKRQ
jgi:hypothetical protein